MSRYLLILVLFISCNSSSNSPSGVGALYDDHTEQIENPNEAPPDCQGLINEYEAKNYDLKTKISNLEEKANSLSVELDDLNSKINDLSIEDYDSQMMDIHSQLGEVKTELQNLKSEF